MVQDLLPALLTKAALDEVFPDVEGNLFPGHLLLHLPDPCSEATDPEKRLHPVRKIARNRDLHSRAGIDPTRTGFLSHLNGPPEPFLKIREIRLHRGGAVQHYHLTCRGGNLSL